MTFFSPVDIGRTACADPVAAMVMASLPLLCFPAQAATTNEAQAIRTGFAQAMAVVQPPLNTAVRNKRRGINLPNRRVT
jgi:hypothetical protein